jgi:hypothetical protein
VGIIAPRSPADRAKHSLIRTTYEVDGDVTLTPTNLYNNWAFLLRDLAGDPEGLKVGMPEEPEGLYVYMTEKNQAWGTATAQNSKVIPIADTSWVLDEPWVPGHPPRTPLFGAKIAPPLQPQISIIAASKTGFAIGTYQIAYSWAIYTASGSLNSTPLSPFLSVSIGTTGNVIQATLPTSAPEGATHLLIWATQAGEGITGARMQEAIPVRDALRTPAWTIAGPYKNNGRTAPNRNETIPPRPKRPKVRQVRGLSPGLAGTYWISVRFINEQGRESQSSPGFDDPLVITEAEAKAKTHISVHFQDPATPGVVGYRIYVTRKIGIGSDASIESFVYGNLSKVGRQGRAIPKNESPSFSGRTYGARKQGEDDVLIRLDGDTVGAIEEGIAAPATEIEKLQSSGKAGLEAGTYRIGISYYVRGEETIAVPYPNPITVTSGQSIQVFFPDPINLFKNSQMAMLDIDGYPMGWGLTGVAGGANEGSAEIIETGALRLFTNGNKTGAQLTPQLTNTFTVDRSQYYAIGGTFSVSYGAGTIEVSLEELSDTGSIVRTTTLKSVTATGEVDFERVFGVGLTGATAFHDSTVTARMVLKFLGATRNGTVTIAELYAHPHPSRLRRIEAGDEPRSVDNPDPPPYIGWRRAGNKAVAPAPKRRRTPAAIKPIDIVDFGGDTPSFPGGWTATNIPSTLLPGTASQIDPAAKIDGSFGYRIAKYTASTAKMFLQKTYTPNDRTRLGVRAKMRFVQIPSRGLAHILGINTLGPGFGYRDIAYLSLDNLGNLYLTAWNNNNTAVFRIISSGIVSGTVLDLELIVREAGTVNGQIFAGVGKNGATRTFVDPYVGIDLRTMNPKTVYVGPFLYADPASTIDMHIDSITVTDNGDALVTGGSSPALEPLPTPDRPLKPPTYHEQVEFSDGAFPGTWTQTRTPADATTTLTVQSASAISSVTPAYGLRVSDTGSAASATVVGERSVTSFITSDGNIALKTRFRVVTRPTTGTVRFMSVRDASDRGLAYVFIDSTGAIYAQGQSIVGSSPAALLVAQGVTNGTICTLELQLLGTGTPSGSLAVWFATGGTGVITERKLMGQPQPMDWTGGLANKVRVGLFNESALAVTATFDFDDIAITKTGESIFDELTDAGTEINQLWLYYPKGQPVRNDLGPRTPKEQSIAVEPGETYTGGVQSRHSAIPTTAASFPCTFTAYDLAGRAYPLGSLYGDTGASGTEPWADRTRTFVIPKKGEIDPVTGEVYESSCYEVRMDSPGISEGEYVFQKLRFSPGPTAIAEVTYPDDGSMWVTLDAEVPLPPPDPVAPTSFIENFWLNFASIVNVPAGTNVTYEYAATDDLVAPTSWYTDFDDMPDSDRVKRYAHARLVLISDPTLRLTPTIRSGSPYLEYATLLAGSRHIPKLLRADGSEFPGGVYAIGVSFPTSKAEYDISKPKGRTFKHRRTDYIMRLRLDSLRCHTEEAKAEIEQTCLDEDFVLEVHDRRFRFGFVEDIEFEFVNEGTGNVLRPAIEHPNEVGNFYAQMDASISEPVEVYEIAEMTPLYPALGLVEVP